MAAASTPPSLDVFEAFYTENYGFVWSVLRRFGVVGAATDDAAQDTFVIAHRRFADFDGASRRAWLYAIARRVASNHRRSAHRGTRRERALQEVGTASSCVTTQIKARLLLERALSRLSTADRELFFLSEVDGFSGPDLAEALRLNPNTVYWRIRRLRRRLKEALGELDEATTALHEERPERTSHGWIALMPMLEGPSPSPIAAASWLEGSSRMMLALTAGVALTAGAAGVFVRTVVSSENDAAHVSRLRPVSSARSVAPSSARASQLPFAPPTLQAPQVPRRPPSVPPTKTRSHPSSPTATPVDPLATWNRRLQEALAAIQSGDGQRALALTEPPATPLPTPLDDLRIALRIEASCTLGNRSEAQRAAHAFFAARPSTALRARVEKTCAATTTSSDAGHSGVR